MSSYQDDYEFWDYCDEAELPPLIKTTSKIIHSVVHDDLEVLKLLMIDYPHDIFEIRDERGYKIFHISIICESFAVFDFFLSLDDCPLEVPAFIEIYYKPPRDPEKITPLQIALGYSVGRERFINEYFARSLIEKGADLNSQNDEGETPLHIAINCRNEEAICMMLYFGADPSIPNFEGTLPLCTALIIFNDGISLSTQENLLFYTFDNYSTDYDIPLHSDLLDLLRSKSPLVPDVLKYITSVNTDRSDEYSYCFYSLLNDIKPDYLELLIEKFDYILRVLTDPSLQGRYGSHDTCTAAHFKNFNLLLQSSFSSNLIQFISEEDIIRGLISYLKRDDPALLNLTFEMIIFLLSYGANIYDNDLDRIYKIYGDCEFFRILLHMDILKKNNLYPEPDIMSVLMYDIHADIETFLGDSNKYRLESVKEALNYFAHPKLQKFCRSLPEKHQEIIAQVNKLPTVPLLVELARNEVRKFLIRKYKIKNSRQLYTLIKALPISSVHEKIICFETPLY